MDPQLEEYRRKQRERAAAAAAAKPSSPMARPWLLVGAVVAVAAIAAMVHQQGIPSAAAQITDQGTCPKPTGVGICVEECSSHGDCSAQGKLCCSNGCGHVCMDAVTPGAAEPDRKCVLMVTLAGKDYETVLKAVPSPSSSNVMKGIGIVTFEFDAGRSESCCAAERALRNLEKEVQYVEYDGQAPACALQGRQLQDQNDPPEVFQAFVSEQIDEEPAVGIDEGAEDTLVGGWTNAASTLDEEALDVWNQVLAKTPVHENHNLAEFGKPVSVKTQIVAGTNYLFGFSGGASVKVFHQPWTQTLEISDVQV